MRFKITLSCEAGTSVPVNNSYYLASMIYRAIERANPKLSTDLHVLSEPKFFTFSKLFVPGRKFRIEGDKLFIESDEAYFFFSAIREEIATALVEGLLKHYEIKIFDAEFSISKIEVIREKKIGKREKFVTLSPIYVSKSVNGKAVDLYPTQQEFYEILAGNLIKKYIVLRGREPEDSEVSFKVKTFKPKRILVKDTWHRCCEMVFEAKGNPELLEIGYKAGFGSKNSMGFGMVKATGKEDDPADVIVV